jgi:hypothetical protein
MKIRVVCATRESEEAFWAVTATGRSLQRLGIPRANVRLFASNTEGLGSCYRTAILECVESPAILAFIHDDVSILDYFWRETVLRMLNKFDVIGLAGGKTRQPMQGAWSCVDPLKPTLDPNNVSGIVGHGSNVLYSHLSYYGPPEQEVKLLDGLFLVADSAVLLAKGVCFDPRFDFHMYDIDFSRQCERAGLRMGTAPISVVHHGAGLYESASWAENYQRYLMKWHEGDANVNNHQFLKLLHADLQPRGYVEIGVYTGASLSLATCDSLGVDPTPRIQHQLGNKAVVVASTSDDFFADITRVSKFLPEHVDLAYIDGMHLVEFALRDFANLEQYAGRNTVICFDDVLPYDTAIATRHMLPGDWTGDVWKVIDLLDAYRPDLKYLLVNTQPTGTLVVYGFDPNTEEQQKFHIYVDKDDPLKRDIDPPQRIIDREGAVSVEDARVILLEWRGKLLAAAEATAELAQESSQLQESADSPESP